MFQEFISLRSDLEMLRTAFGNALKVGPIEVVDAAKGYRLKLGENSDGTPYLSPWYPHPESGGQASSWMPLSKGQIVGVMNPSGDPRQGVILRSGFSDENAPPSADLAAIVLKALGITFTVKDGKVTLEGDLHVKGNVVLTGDVDFESGHVQHNSTNIGDTHVHFGVVPGGADTKLPH